VGYSTEETAHMRYAEFPPSQGGRNSDRREDSIGPTHSHPERESSEPIDDACAGGADQCSRSSRMGDDGDECCLWRRVNILRE